MATKLPSVVHEHFIRPTARSGHIKGKCKYCEWTISTSGKTTYNLLNHLKHNHDAELQKSTFGSGTSAQMLQPTILNTSLHILVKSTSLTNLPILLTVHCNPSHWWSQKVSNLMASMDS
ncbi:uncharacterized protein LOC111087734 [Limulus polyphemus]|uniref:Uncharacterized protein LOC111087734 n=1 Tax=Limulus polyphemus TaxID=6850 RepID=A0ABM1T5I5_LIMPO|nr:uncharacterized protein LOC111087734 [Limulus polyphemus]